VGGGQDFRPRRTVHRTRQALLAAEAKAATAQALAAGRTGDGTGVRRDGPLPKITTDVAHLRQEYCLDVSALKPQAPARQG
jgi:hypothetical protein